MRFISVKPRFICLKPDTEWHDVIGTLLMGEGAEISANGDNDVEVVQGILALLSAKELDIIDGLVQSSILRCQATRS